MPARLTAELRRWLTAQTRYPVLATIADDGRPSQSVIWAMLEPNDRILMNTRRDRAKAHNLERDPRASLCYQDGYAYLTLEGRVEQRPDPDNRDIERIRDAYGDSYDFSSQLGERVSLVMTIERVLVHLTRL